VSLKLTAKQQEAQELLGSDARHNLLVGGSRSGKTFLLCCAIALRAVKAVGSRHLIARFGFNQVKASIWFDTFSKMMGIAFPSVVKKLKYDKTDFMIRFPNGSEVWFGGLDDKERTDKILGQEYSTIFLNECSQIGWPTIETVRTRLAQNVGLKLKMYYDANPPLATHWTHKLFVEKREPMPPYKMLPAPEQYVWMRINPTDNTDNLPKEYLDELATLGDRARRRFLAGEWGSANENALWTYDVIDKFRVTSSPDMTRIIIGVDPSGTQGEEDERSDHVGIVVVGLGTDGEAYVLEDCTVKLPPEGWGRGAVKAYDRHMADAIVAETNYGGAMVASVIRSAAASANVSVNFLEVTASRGKHVRAEPISTLYEQGKVHHVGGFPHLEDQLCAFTTAGYMGDRSPDRGDALIWALSELFPGMTRKKPKGEVKVENCSTYHALN
jgi:predicted phage terminase large subunit-like protein